MRPTATYRIQFHEGFTLADARAIVPYLHRLGISHLYASPLLAARPGSPHGYDIIDHGRISHALGGMEGLRSLVSALRERGMGLLLDIVPNHMGVGGADNALWLDVLECGQASPYARWFDIDWQAPDPRLTGRVLAPFLGLPYGEALASGELALRVHPETGTISAWYHEHRFPIAPRDYRDVLPKAPTGHAALDGAIEAFAALARLPRARQREAALPAKRLLADALRSPDAMAHLGEALARYDVRSGSGEALHALLDRQAYRLVWWRAAADEINYRRFFDINGLAGFRVELPGAFDAAHRLLLDLWQEGLVDGFRVDHVDGLADPRAYCRKLRRRMEAVASARPGGLAREPWIVVEKILAAHEHLPAEWATDGTTGYEVMDRIGALLHDADGEPALTEAWRAACPAASDFHAVERDARRQILADYLAAELGAVALAIHRVLQRDLATRDHTLTAIRRVLRAVISEFPVYRTYAALSGARGADGYVLDWAFTRAVRSVRPTQRDLLALLRPILSGEALRASRPGPARQELHEAVRRFQQLTGPVAAKSVEDTSFYRYLRLASRNEVGSDPSRLATTPSAFNRFMRSRRRTPHALSATATHDHKRGEDVRARLALLSELPTAWVATVERWRRLNAPLKVHHDHGEAPDPGDELHLYQTLVGAWPIGLEAEDRDGIAAYLARIEGWFVKALREGKRHSDWALPNADYEQACLGFLHAAMDERRAARFDREVAAQAQAIAAAGAAKGLVQVALKITCPGVPDIYQGTELWDLSLVDPDNRRPVDFTAIETLLDAQAGGGWHDGGIKARWTARLLALRRDNPELFAAGTWAGLSCRGRLRERVICAARASGDAALLVVGLPCPAALLESESMLLAPSEELRATSITIPDSLTRYRSWRVLRPDAEDQTWEAAASMRLANMLDRSAIAVAIGTT